MVCGITAHVSIPLTLKGIFTSRWRDLRPSFGARQTPGPSTFSYPAEIPHFRRRPRTPADPFSAALPGNPQLPAPACANALQITFHSRTSWRIKVLLPHSSLARHVSISEKGAGASYQSVGCMCGPKSLRKLLRCSSCSICPLCRARPCYYHGYKIFRFFYFCPRIYVAASITITLPISEDHSTSQLSASNVCTRGF